MSNGLLDLFVLCYDAGKLLQLLWLKTNSKEKYVHLEQNFAFYLFGKKWCIKPPAVLISDC